MAGRYFIKFLHRASNHVIIYFIICIMWEKGDTNQLMTTEDLSGLCPHCHIERMKKPFGIWKCPGCGYCPEDPIKPIEHKTDHLDNLESRAISGNPDAIKELIEMLKLPDKYNIRRISDALTNSGSYSSSILIESYIDEIKNKGQYGHRVILLEIIKDTFRKCRKEDLLKLLQHLTDVPSETELTQIIDIIQRIRVPESVIPLVILFEHSNLPEIRKRIINALVSIGNEKANENLIKFLELSKSESESIFLIDKLEKIANSNSITSIMNCLKKDSIIIRFRAIRALGDIGDSKTIIILIDHLKGNVSCDEEIAVIRAIGKIKGKIAVDYLINRVYDQPQNLQIAIIETLGSIDDSKENERIKRIFINLIDTNWKNDSFVRIILSNIKSPDVYNYVDKYRQEQKCKRKVEAFIKELEDDRTKRASNRQWNHSNIRRNHNLDNLLVNLKPDEMKKIIELLNSDLKGSDRLLRLRAVELLKKIPDLSAKKMLESLKNDLDIDIRRRARD